MPETSTEQPSEIQELQNLETAGLVEQYTNQIQMSASKPLQAKAQQHLSSESSSTALLDQRRVAERTLTDQVQPSEYPQAGDLPPNHRPPPETLGSSSILRIDHPEVAEYLEQSFVIFKDDPLQQSCAFCRYGRFIYHYIELTYHIKHAA